MRFESPKCVCGQSCAQDPTGNLQRSPDRSLPSWIWGEKGVGKGEGGCRDVNKATDSKAKAKATPCKAEAEAEAEASVPWHKLVIMHNLKKNILAIL